MKNFRELLGPLLETWQEFDIGPGHRSKLRQESDFGLGRGSRLKMNTAEECVLCILMGLVKTLNTVIMGPLFMLCLFLNYSVYTLGLTILCLYLEWYKSTLENNYGLQPQHWLESCYSVV